MKNEELQHLLKEIVRSVLNELTSLSQSDMKAMLDNPSMDASVSPTDAMTPAEKAKSERDAESQRRKDIRTADLKLKSVKTQSDYYKQQEKQNRLDIIAKQKDLQNLKAGKTISSGGAGSISST